MFYLKIQNPNGDGTILAAATPHNMYAFCSVCGTQVHLRQQDLIFNPILWGPNYMCPKCRKAMEEMESMKRTLESLVDYEAEDDSDDDPDEDDDIFGVTHDADDSDDSHCCQCGNGHCSGHCGACRCHGKAESTVESEKPVHPLHANSAAFFLERLQNPAFIASLLTDMEKETSDHE